MFIKSTLPLWNTDSGEKKTTFWIIFFLSLTITSGPTIWEWSRGKLLGLASKPGGLRRGGDAVNTGEYDQRQKLAKHSPNTPRVLRGGLGAHAHSPCKPQGSRGTLVTSPQVGHSFGELDAMEDKFRQRSELNGLCLKCYYYATIKFVFFWVAFLSSEGVNFNELPTQIELNNCSGPQCSLTCKEQKGL